MPEKHIPFPKHSADDNWGTRNLDALRDAAKSLDIKDSCSLDNYLIGALANYIAPKTWAYLIESALETLHDQKARQAKGGQ